MAANRKLWRKPESWRLASGAGGHGWRCSAAGQRQAALQLRWRNGYLCNTMLSRK